MKKEYLDFIDFVLETGDFNYDNNLSEVASNFRKKYKVNFTIDDLNYIIDYYENELFEHIPGLYPQVVKLTLKANTIKREHGSFTAYYNHMLSNQIESDEIENIKKEITKLTKTNLELQNRSLKREIILATIFMVIGAIITNIKDIIVCIKQLMQYLSE